MRRIIHRLLNVFRGDRAGEGIDRELASHLALLEEEHRCRGLTPDEARLAARRAIGSVALVKDLHRDARSFAWLEDVLSDVKHSVRSLRRAPAFTAIAVLTLALGIGANTAIFSVVNTVLLRPLPFAQADRLVRVVMAVPAQTTGSTERRDPVRISATELDQLRASVRTLSTVGVVEPTLMNLRGRDPRLQGAIVSAGFFEMLHARPQLGRAFTVADEAAGAAPVLLLSQHPQASLFYVAPMEQVVASTISRPRLYATLLGVFSIVGLGLAVIGIYGVMSYWVAQRTREIGIRVALGARRRQVIALVMGQSAVLTAVGIVVGLSGAALLSRYLEGLLFGVTPLDPTTFAVSTALFAIVALVAAARPVRRATGVDPLVALRAE